MCKLVVAVCSDQEWFTVDLRRPETLSFTLYLIANITLTC